MYPWHVPAHYNNKPHTHAPHKIPPAHNPQKGLVNTVQTTEYRHAHPIMIITNLSRVLYLLIIPFLRGMVLALLGSGLAAWLRGAWFDILIVLMIMGIAAIRWRLLLYRFDRTGLYIRRGLFFRQEGFIPLANICTMCAERSWLLIPLRAAVLRADTSGGSPRQFDFEIIAYKKDAQEAMELRIASCRDAVDPPAHTLPDEAGSQASSPPLEQSSPLGSQDAAPPADTRPAAPSCPLPQPDAGARQGAFATPTDIAAEKQVQPVDTTTSAAGEHPIRQAAPSGSQDEVPPISTPPAAPSCPLPQPDAGARQNDPAPVTDVAAEKQVQPVDATASAAGDHPSGQAAPSGSQDEAPPTDTPPTAPSYSLPQPDAGARQNDPVPVTDAAAEKLVQPVDATTTATGEHPSGQAALAAPAERVFRPHSLYVAALSAFLSNSFAGVLLASAFINRAGTVLGEELEGRVLSTLTQISGWLAFGIPPVAATVGLIILVGWFIGFMGNLLRLTRFRIERTERALTVNLGLITRRTYSVLVEKINYLDIRQSLMTKLLRLYLVFIQATGYGKGKNEVAALIPSATRKDLAATMTMLLPGIRPHARAVRPQKSAWLRYVFLPLLLLPALPIATYIALRLLPAWRDVIRFFGLMLWVPILWLLLLKLVDYFTAGLCREGGTLTLRYSKGFMLHTVVVPINRAAMTVCSRSVLQRRGGGCDIIVYTYSESGRMVRRTHIVRSLPVQEALRELGLPCKERDKASQSYHFS